MAESFHIALNIRSMLNADGGVLLNINTGRCYSLNAFGARIWTLISSGYTRGKLLEELKAQCSISPDQLEQDVDKFVTGLESAGMLIANFHLPRATGPEVDVLTKSRLPIRNGKPITVLTLPVLGAWCAFMLLMALDLILKLRGFSAFYKVVQNWPVRGIIADDSDLIGSICAKSDQAAAYYFRRALCLQRAALTTCLLRSVGVPAQFVMGCRKYPFYGHAWVEVNGKVINDPQNVQKFFTQMDRC